MRLINRQLIAALGVVSSATLIAAGLAASSPTPAMANGSTVSGAGSTWVQIALDQWRADIARAGYSVNYQSVGSSAGRQFYIANQVDFAASEIPFYPSELQQLQAEGKSFQYVPDVAGGTSLMYNLHAPNGNRITSLRLDATTAAKIFTGAITSWQDPAIQALNPGLQIADSTIIPVIRSDGSGTSAQFSLYLASQAPNVWNAFASSSGCPAPCSVWPAFNGSIQQSGSDGVANFVANDAVGAGAIGYVEAGFAFGRAFPVASLHNASGHFTPEANDPFVFSRDVATALSHATLNADLTQNLSGVYVAPEADAYPMSSYSYLITQTAGFDPGKGFVLGTWMIYIACAGQQEATPLGYSPMPANLVHDVFDAVRRIPGAPAPPPIDAQHCPNPNVTGQQTIGAAGGHGGSTAHTGSSAATAGPAVSQSSAGATAAAVAGVGGLGTVSGLGTTPVATMSAAQRASSFLLAEQAASRARVPTSLALFVAAAIVLIAVFGPAILMRRRVPK